jgi:5-methylcytosine-specific restriction endonuclease McrA
VTERRKNTDISAQSRHEVHRRDERRCVYCGRTDKPIELAHFISRSQGGKGVPQNLITLCIDCHRSFDGAGRDDMRDFLADYLKSHYSGWNEQDQIFRKR